MSQQQQTEDQATTIERLKKAIEAKAGRKILTPKDFDYLSACIAEELHEPISVSTLKRLWGYIQSSSNPRLSTLDMLSQFVGSENWETFRQSSQPEAEQSQDNTDTPDLDTEAQTPQDTNSISTPPDRHTSINKMWIPAACIIGLLLCGLIAWLYLRPQYGKEHEDDTAMQRHLLRSGQTFNSPGDYLLLFGITATNHPWSQPVPHHDGIIVWGPEYRHAEWHNEGLTDSLMPTITEYWTPADSLGIPAEVIATRNADNYLRATAFNELRITFMKGIGRKDTGNPDERDTAYTFLGVYRLNIEQSDTTRLVWQRVAEECDLANLGYLEQLRN